MDRRPPLVARALLRLIPLGERRDETEQDLLELFRGRAARQGYGTATVRYLHDVISLFLNGGIVNPLDGVGRDFKYAVRMFARQPLTMGITVLGLGLAIAVSGSIFTLMNVALLRSDGVPDSARAPRVFRTVPNGVSTAWDYDEYRRLRESAKQSRVEAWISDSAPFSLTSMLADEPPTIPVAYVSGNYLQALGAKTVAGRVLAESDATPAAPPTVVVSHAFWTRHLSSDPAIVGRTLQVGRISATVVGVVERSFTAPFNNGTGLWMPMSIHHLIYGGKEIGFGSSPEVAVVARLRPNVSLAAAEAELTAIASTFDTSNDPERRAGARFGENGRGGGPSKLERIAATVAVGIVISLVLLLACVNVATVLLANATTRQREIGVRLALGATRGRIVRQLLTESVLISTAATAIGLVLAVWMGPLVKWLVRAPSTLDVPFDLTVYLFFVAVAFACGLGAGLLPARVGARGDVVTPLKGAGSGETASTAPRRMRSTLLGMQAAASVLLLVLATLFLRATVRATQVNVGFDAGRLVSVSAGFGRSPRNAASFWDSAIERAEVVPGVERAAVAQYPPFGGGSEIMLAERGGTRMVTYFNRTSANYFTTVGLRLIRGRTFTAEEVANNAHVAVISETVARRHWPGGDPLGSNIKTILDTLDATVIGIVSDAIVARLHEGTHGAIYQPLSGDQAGTGRLVARVSGDPALAARPLREALRSIDPTLTVRSELVKDGLEEEISTPRTVAMVAGGMALLAVVLAAIGLYGVSGAVVGQRTREIGLRMALGAERGDVERQLMRESLRPVLVGLAAGVVLALIGGRAIAGFLYGVAPYDPLAFGGAVSILLASAVTAVLIPTRNASKVDPAFVLRQE